MTNVTVIELSLAQRTTEGAIQNILGRAEELCRNLCKRGPQPAQNPLVGIVVSTYHLNEDHGRAVERFDSNGEYASWSDTSFSLLTQ